ncbi:MAG: formate/nitrite transporter family protein [Mycoplasmoidaceae bacterium]
MELKKIKKQNDQPACQPVEKKLTLEEQFLKIKDEKAKNKNLHLKFALEKVNYNFTKKLILSMMGGVFAGIGYIGFNTLNGGSYDEFGNFIKDFGDVGLFFGALLFPIGIMMCIFLGGNLFTSNVLVIMGVYAKKVKFKLFVHDLLVTLMGNVIGGILISLLSFGSSIYWTFDQSSGFEINNIGTGVMYLADKKVSTEWWSNILSGILCNMIVAGSIYTYVKVNNRAIGSMLVYLFIVVFAICGFQHVVANTFVFTEASLLNIIAPLELQAIFGRTEMGESFYVNMIPTIIGNVLGGILISSIYMYLEGEKIRKSSKTEFNIIVPEEDEFPEEEKRE